MPQVLPLKAYFEADFADRERAVVFDSVWHLVGLRSEWKRAGHQRALSLGSTEVLVRRGGDLETRSSAGLRAFVNVCVHRHSLLVSAGDSCADRIVCPYHGFEYGDDGSLRSVPDAPSFRRRLCQAEDTDHGGWPARLLELPVETHGELVFVATRPRESTAGSSAIAPLDEATVGMARAAFTPRHRLVARYRMELPCNWKVALENVLENFHVPSLHQNVLARHPEIFRLFTGTARGQATHELRDASTSYHDTMGGEVLGRRSSVAARFAESMRPGSHPRYEHLHAFPNVVLAMTHLVSFAQVFMPTSPTTCVMEAWLAMFDDDETPRWLRAARPVLRAAAKTFMAKVLAEDASIYARVQRGLEISPHRGVLSAREERVHAFQRWLWQRTRETSAIGGSAAAERKTPG